MIKIIKKNPLFMKLASINLFSKIGDKLFYTAMLTVAASLPESNLGITIVSVSETLPILFSFILGNLADRKTKKVEKLTGNAIFRAFLYVLIGFSLNYSVTLKLVIAMAALNFISDLFGNYSSALIAPFTKILVKVEDMAEAQSLISLTTQLINVVSNFLGSFLLGILLASSIAYINSVVFLVVAVGYAFIKKNLSKHEKEIPIVEHSESIIATTKTTFISIFKNKLVFNDLFQLALINGFFGGVTPIFVMYLSYHREQMIVSNALTISIFSGLITIFMVIGNGLTTKILKNILNRNLAIFSDISLGFVAFGFITNSLALVLLSISCASFFLGIISPRFTANIINTYPTEQLGGIVTTVNSLLVIVPPITGLVFPMIAIVSLSIIYVIFFLYAILLIMASLLLR